MGTLLAVYPANIQMAVDAGRPRDAEGWAAWLRLPLQLPMIRWAHGAPVSDPGAMSGVDGPLLDRLHTKFGG